MAKKQLTKEVLRLPSVEKFEVIKASNEDEGFYIEGWASKVNPDRDMEIINSDIINTDNYLKNPVILDSHDRSEPIGKCISIEKRAEGLWIKCFISKTASRIRTLISEGIITAFSVGFRIFDYKFLDDGTLVYKDIELLEVSTVSVPCHQDAIFQMCKSYNEQNLIKDVKKESKTIKKENIMTPEEIKEMQESIARMKAEKEALEAEKAAKIAAEKEAKEAKEKAEMLSTIKTLTETIKSTQEAIEIVKAEAVEKEAKLAEEMEAIKKTSSRIEMPDADEATVKAHMRSYQDALLLSDLYKKEAKDTLAFSRLPERAKAISWDSSFTTTVRDIMLSDIRNEAALFGLFREIPSEVTTDSLPFNPELSASWVSSASDQTWTPTKVDIPYNSLMTRVDYNYVTDEETVITWLSFIKQNMVEALAAEIDAQILDTAATPTGTFRGIAGHAIEAGFTVAMADELDITVGDVDNLRASMGKYGVKPDELALVLNSAKYLQIVDDDAVSTVDKYGTGATILSGELGRVRGVRIFQNDNAVGSSSTGVTNYAATLFNRKFWLTKMKSFMLEWEKTVADQKTKLVGSVRVGFAPAFTLTATDLASTNTICAIGTNPAT